MTLSSYHPPFKPFIRALLAESRQFSGLFVCSFVCFYIAGIYKQEMYTWCYYYFWLKEVCSLEAMAALNSLTRNLFRQWNTKCRIYWAKKCYSYKASNELASSAMSETLHVPRLPVILKYVVSAMLAVRVCELNWFCWFYRVCYIPVHLTTLPRWFPTECSSK